MLKKIVAALAYLLGAAALLASRVLSSRVKKFEDVNILMPKLLVPPSSNGLAAAGFAGGILGLLTGSPLAFLLGSAGGAGVALYLWRLAHAQADFDRAFGCDWTTKIPSQRASRMLRTRWGWRLPAEVQPHFQQNVVFHVERDGQTRLLCDIWRPPPGVPCSGLGLIYLHGSAWHYLDKDCMTRPMFRHLAGQGHTVMDVAYRLCPEVDFFGMLSDVKHAVAWLKERSEEYGVDPGQIVISGGSAGGHLALMAAYAPNDPVVTPADLLDTDLSVRAVISLYGPTDVRTTFQSGWSLDTGMPIDREAGISGEDEISRLEIGHAAKNWGNQQAAKLATGSSNLEMLSVRSLFTNLLGGVPAAVPHMYDIASPIRYVSPSCPPTLILHGTHDTLVPVDDARRLYNRLTEERVPAVYVELPQTEHGFDLIHPRYSPAARIALFHIDRFLALVGAGAADVPEQRARELLPAL